MRDSSWSHTYEIPSCWVYGSLIFLAIFGIILGLFSFLFPQNSISLYQVIMQCFKWRVEPMFPEREIGNTRILGFLMLVLSVLLLALAVK